MKLLRTTLLSAAGVSAAFALAACGSGTAAAPVQSSAPAVAAPAATGSAVAGTSASAALSVTQSPLGRIVTDAQGRTLYRFDSDTTSPPASNCAGACAQAWPPALGNPASVTLNGVDKGLVGEVRRADGTEQLTLAGSPLYEFAGDSGPGQTNGQAVMGTWWAITPQGAKIAGAAGAAAPATDDHGGHGGPGDNGGSGGTGGGY